MQPYIILTLGFIFIVTLLLWFIIGTKGKWVVKFITIPIAMWFSMFLYFTPPQLSGYPSIEKMKEDRPYLIKYFTYRTPDTKDKGAIFLLVDLRFGKKETLTWVDRLNPKYSGDISDTELLRLYQLEYDEKLIKKMIEESKKGGLMTITMKNGKAKGDKDGKGKDGNGKDGKGKDGNGNGKDGKGDKSGDGDGGGMSKFEYNFTVEVLKGSDIHPK